jgi:arabinose-5-phosphate isomerase
MTELMLRDYCITCGATIRDAVAVIERNAARCCIVLGPDQKVIGVFSEGDVMRCLLRGTDLHTPLRQVIRPTFVSLRSRDMDAALDRIRTGITLIPVLDDEFRLTDVITLGDVLQLVS